MKNISFKKSFCYGGFLKALWLGVIMLVVSIPSTYAQTSKDSKEFSIAVLPDTQYYTSEMNGGTNAYFEAQTEWIVENREKENIVYVVHVGDIVQNGDKHPEEWERAVKAMYTLEKPQPGLPHGIPYGVAVGNHDQDKSQFALSGETYYYNKYFGIDHFKDREYYGGHYRNDNDSHYALFSAGAMDFIVIYIEYDSFNEDQDNMNNWAVELLEKYADREAILVSHYLIGQNKVPNTNLEGEAEFGKQGQRLYDRLKTQPNLFMMLSGHVGANGEGYRQDTDAGNTIKTFLQDYQSRPNGGDGLMRLFTFSPEKDLISIKTLSPTLGTYERDGDSEFVRPWFREVTGSRIFDFNNDGKSEAASFHNGNWRLGDSLVAFGSSGDIPLPANYFGNGQASLGVYDPDEAVFRIKGKEDQNFGELGDIPLPHDYSGDGITNLALWRPSNSTWHIQGKDPVKHGWSTSIPVPADYDGDGKVEIAILRVENNTWYIRTVGNVPFGQEGDIPVPGDYNGDGIAEVAVYRPSTAEWLVMDYNQKIVFGEKGDIPVPGDYDGSGKIQPAVYTPSTGKLRTYTGLEFQLDTQMEIVNLPYHIKQHFFEN